MNIDEERTIMKDTMKIYKRKERDQEKGKRKKEKCDRGENKSKKGEDITIRDW